jgi:hypothetical protein
MASSTHALSGRKLRQGQELRWNPRRKEISPRYLQRSGINTTHATSCNCLPCKLPRDFFYLAGSRVTAQWWWFVGRDLSMALDLHRIWENRVPASVEAGVGSGPEPVPFQPRLLPRQKTRRLNIPTLTTTAGNMAWSIQVTWVV